MKRIGCWDWKWLMFKFEDFDLGNSIKYSSSYVIKAKVLTGIILGIHDTRDSCLTAELLIGIEKQLMHVWGYSTSKRSMEFLNDLKNFRSNISLCQLMQFNLQWVSIKQVLAIHEVVVI